ncbi:MAG: ATP-binding cassette domain-containing protein [Clostridia bacterium]|nr:ATP-binding cassette domain-containing protein [Clostridia bacterium]
MLKLTDIVKSYSAGSNKVEALRGVSIAFRENEFVSILGPSGCGKTTMLNIIGGLDRYDSGDLSINDKSTKKFKDGDWDAYRNHSIGFVFQNYNLIPHQSVLSNVELALTLSGVSKSERRKRATEVLQKVGLGDQLRKKPNQMSGGQMQRVAIARALVNNPEILLADEPTGALDSGTSVQIMELLKEIAKEKLVIMVTHNPDLAGEYSSRIVKLLDGRITDDSNPYSPGAFTAAQTKSEGTDSKGKKKKEKKQKTSMSMLTAFSLSLNNLMTKKGRTILTAFAGSIGIIGIALILSLSNGFQLYIDKVQEDTLSSYPLTIQKESVDIGTMIATLQEERSSDAHHDMDKVYSSTVMADLMNTMIAEAKINNLAAFKQYIEQDENGQKMQEYTSAIQYSYDAPLNVFSADTSNGAIQVNPSKVMEKMMPQQASSSTSIFTQNSDSFWSELIDNPALLDSQYDMLAGRWPQSFDEVVVAVTKKNEISDVELYSLGLKDQREVDDIMKKVMSGEAVDIPSLSFTYDELLELRFRLLLSSELYAKDPLTGMYKDLREDEILLKKAVDGGVELKVVGIVRPNPDAASASITGVIGYTHELMEYVIRETEKSELVREQKARPETDVFTGLPFEKEEEEQAPPDFSAMTPEQQAEFRQAAEEQQRRTEAFIATLPEETQQYLASLPEEERARLIAGYTEQAQPRTTYEENLAKLGVADLDDPSIIRLYPVDFESKEHIEQLISDYNQGKSEEEQISYSDIVGIMMSSISTIINMISYVLIAFVSISLVVSSIMIGIITYISVLERTKEIGILRSIGASKKDISRVFNAETLIIGFVAGALGIGSTLLLNLPVNALIKSLSGISDVSKLPLNGAVVLVLISMALTLIAGLIPSGLAAKKDPVVALRTE